MSLLAVVAASAAVTSSAQASKYVDRFVGTTASGGLGGQFNTPRGVAVNDATVDGNGTDGWFYVADDNNHRIQAFNAAGDFQWAIGRNVIDPGATTDTDLGDVFEKCTTAADCKAGAAGTGTGMFDNPQAVAVNQATGDIYVRDRDNRRVQQFTADGDFIRMWGFDVISGAVANDNGTLFEVCDVTNGNVAADCKVGTNGSGDGQFGSSSAATGLDIQQSTGDVFVADPGGSGNRRIQRFESDGTFVAKFGSSGNPFGSGLPAHIAVDDSSGTVYATNSTTNPNIERYDLDSSSFLSPLNLAGVGFEDLGVGSGQITALGMGADGNLLLRGQGNGAIFELSSADGVPELFDTHDPGPSFGTSTLGVLGLALNVSSGDLHFTSNTGPAAYGHRVYTADDDGATPAVVDLLPATAVGADTATLHAEVTSPGPFFTDYRLEVSRNGTDWQTVGTGQLAGDTADVPVSATAEGLRPNTLYRFRVVHSREFANPELASAELTFLTDAVKPSIADVRATSIGDTTATLQGRVNPHSAPTNYRFEYGVGAFNRVLPVPDGAVGSGPGFVFVSQQLVGLVPGTTYQYRLVAASPEGTTTGATRTFTAATGPGGDEARAYELVSPADKVGGVGVGVWRPGVLAAGAGYAVAGRDGGRVAVAGALGSVLLDSAQAYATDWAFADRTPAGWLSHSPMTHAASNQQAFRFIQMDTASDDLSTVAWSSNLALLRPFPELASWPTDPSTDAPFAGDWDGRWELVAPTKLDQVFGVTPANTKLAEPVASADGSHLASTTQMGPGSRSAIGGMAGEDDPGHPANADFVGGRLAYLMDVSGGLSDRYAGNSVHHNVGVCTGTAGVDRTELPGVTAGSLVARECPAGVDGRDRMISDRGAVLQSGAIFGDPSNSVERIVSRDGARTFFMSPDPHASGTPSACSGSGDTTSCPPQLYVRQRNADGSVVTRWLSRAEDGLFGTQAASLTGHAIFEGASTDGGTVYFRTNSPLTADDPNGTGSAPVTTGTASSQSWDLYRYDLADGSDPTGPGAQLTRVSRGPTGAADANGLQTSARAEGLLRFSSADGQRAYFVTAAPIPGVADPSNGTTTTPGGTPTTADTANLYAYDSTGDSESWEFVARLPRSTGTGLAGGFDSCATTGNAPTSVLASTQKETRIGFRTGVRSNCVRGTDDGTFVTFWTSGRLTPDDADSVTVDLYGYDASADDLTRITASQGGVGDSYPCGTDSASDTGAGVTPCHGSDGFRGLNGKKPILGVATDPQQAGDRVAFFHSRSRLVPEDTDEAYDVYEWRNGDLSLVSTGASATDGAFLYGNDATGRNVYFATFDKLSWQDVDTVLDVYTARTGGGIPQPQPPSVCQVLAGGCHADDDGQSVAPAVGSVAPRGGNVAEERRRVVVSLAVPGRRARARASRTGVLAVRVRSSAAGRVGVVARGRIGRRTLRIGRASRALARPGVVTVRVRLNRRARRALAAGRRLPMRVVVSAPGARKRTVQIALRRAGR